MGTAKRAYDILRGYIGQEWERISGNQAQDAYAELDGPAYVPPASATQSVPSTVRNPHDEACRILGVETNADFPTVRKAFERLDKRADPSKFPGGSPEAKQAADIQVKIRWAYKILTENVDPSEKRFRTLEVEP